MDRVVAMLILLGMLVGMALFILAFFSIAPVFCSCIMSLLYTLYLFVANESSGVHHAQEFENRFWTIFAVLFSTALFFANDSPIAIGRWSPSLGFLFVLTAGYGMHAYDRYAHRKEMSREHGLKRGSSAATSLNRLKSMGIPVEEQLLKINSCLSDIDQLLIPSTINNFINQRFILQKEREIITILEDSEPKALNYLVQHLKLGLLFYKVKDHRHFGGQHRTELIELLAVTRISVLSVLSRVLVLHALQMMKLPANARSDYWVRNIILQTHQDDLSELKCLTDAKGDYFCMNKLIYIDIRSHGVRQDILSHLKKEAAVQQAHMAMGTKKSKLRRQKAWRKILSDVDDTLYSSGGSYPAGIDKKYGKKVVYPGVLSFYRELDLGTQGPDEWPSNRIGNLVFLSARPHVYKDVSEKHNFAKFEKLRLRGMHTIPSLLAGDMASGRDFVVQNDMEPLALKKFQNFKEYMSIYPEFKHVFIGDNGQGDVRAGELMFDAFPNHLEALYIHVVQGLSKTHGYAPERWGKKGLSPCFFHTYPDAALHAASRKSPLIRVSGLHRICEDAVKDFHMIQKKQWRSQEHSWERRDELNQGIWRANQFLKKKGEEEVPLIEAERLWRDGQKVRTPYGIATICSFDPVFDMYGVEIDWRPLDVQVAEHKNNVLKMKIESAPLVARVNGSIENGEIVLETVVEAPDEEEKVDSLSIAVKIIPSSHENSDTTTMTPHMTSTDGEGRAIVNNKEMTLSDVTECNRVSLTPSRQSTDISSDYFEGESLSNGIASKQETDLPNKTDSNSVVSSPMPQSANDSSQFFGERESSSGVESSTTASNLPLDENRNSDKDSPGKNVDLTQKQNAGSHYKVIAKLHRSYISKFTPPIMPDLPKGDKGRIFFSFWSGDTSKAKEEPFKPGDKCSTPYGLATVKEYRPTKGIVVVEMTGWKARAYLQEKCVKLVGQGILGSFLRRIKSDIDSSSDKQVNTTPPKELDYLYATGAKIQTPFGGGEISRPLSAPSDKTKNKSIESGASSPKLRSDSSFQKPPDSKASSDLKKPTEEQEVPVQTIEISLTTLTYADGSHPVLYCTPETANEWKNRKFENEESSNKNNLFSVFGSLVSSTMKRISATPPTDKKDSSSEKKPILFERYYKDGAAVTTLFGDGRVQKFRETDGFYEVSLTQCKMKGDVCPMAYLRQDAMSYRLAKGCQEGYPVLTDLGLSGTLASVEPTTGVHIVTIPATGMVCYLQPSSVVRPLKAAVGEDVLTPYGEGIVQKYRPDDDMYQIYMKWGATMYAHGETFDRVHNRVEDRGGPFGMHWLLRYLFFTSDGNKGQSQRSRSNSIVSLSARSVS